MRAFVGVALFSLASVAPVAAQASPYLPVDDSRLPLLEHLIARGDIEDPSPKIRPFQFADALRVLEAADTASATTSGRLVHTLRESLEADIGGEEAWWRFEVRGGARQRAAPGAITGQDERGEWAMRGSNPRPRAREADSGSSPALTRVEW
jgi:hypothetical protein